MSGYLQGQRRRVQKQLLLLAGLLAGVPLLALLGNLDTLQNVLGGPRLLDGQSLGQLTGPRPPARSYVQLVPESVETFQRLPASGDRPAERLMLAQLQGRYLVVLQKGQSGDLGDADEAGDQPPRRLVGHLRRLDEWTAGQLRATRPALPAPALVPLALELRPSYLHDVAILASVLGVLLGGGLAAAGLALAMRLWPEGTPPWRNLRALGPPGELAPLIDGEAADPEAVAAGGLLLTRSFLLCERLFGLRVLPLEELAVAYRYEWQETVAMVTVQREIRLVIGTRQGTTVTTKARPYGVVRFVEELARRAPWVLTAGASGSRLTDEQLLQRWARQRPALLAEVAARRPPPDA